jgi:predicted HNH restriction endonuclease
MAREIIDRNIKNRIFKKYDNKCYIRGFSIKEALRVHHIIPVSYGGTDVTNNLILLCSNCHSMVHIFSSNRFKVKNVETYISKEYSDEKISKLFKIIDDFKKV